MLTDHYFFDTYKCANKILYEVGYDLSFSCIDWTDPKVESSIIKYSKISIFEHYIYAVLLNDFYADFGDKNKNYAFGFEITNIEAGCDIYKIKYSPFDFCKYYPEGEINSKYDFADNEFPAEEVYNWIILNEKSFKKLWKRIASETFQLLFGNRGLLLRFNQSLAQYLYENISPEYISSSGGLKRCQYIPTWCKKAIFYRDRGKCVLCNKDLTNLINTWNKLHYDHMVPLSEFGTNDPCNLQLLCQECNLSKSKKEEITSIKYLTWW